MPAVWRSFPQTGLRLTSPRRAGTLGHSAMPRSTRSSMPGDIHGFNLSQLRLTPIPASRRL